MTTEIDPPPLAAPVDPHRAGSGAAPHYERRFVASDAETRAVLVEVCARLAAAGLDDDDLGSVELVLAEVLNNITEHAYDTSDGMIDLTVELRAGLVHCELRDRGRPMPLGQVPAPRLPMIEAPAPLPEGGFGWHIVRCLVNDLQYQRTGGVNVLRLSLATAGG